jgi:hypothetical protein
MGSYGIWSVKKTSLCGERKDLEEKTSSSMPSSLQMARGLAAGSAARPMMGLAFARTFEVTAWRPYLAAHRYLCSVPSSDCFTLLQAEVSARVACCRKRRMGS